MTSTSKSQKKTPPKVITPPTPPLPPPPSPTSPWFIELKQPPQKQKTIGKDQSFRKSRKFFNTSDCNNKLQQCNKKRKIFEKDYNTIINHVNTVKVDLNRAKIEQKFNESKLKMLVISSEFSKSYNDFIQKWSVYKGPSGNRNNDDLIRKDFKKAYEIIDKLKAENENIINELLSKIGGKKTRRRKNKRNNTKRRR